MTNANAEAGLKIRVPTEISIIFGLLFQVFVASVGFLIFFAMSLFVSSMVKILRKFADGADDAIKLGGSQMEVYLFYADVTVFSAFVLFAGLNFLRKLYREWKK